MRTERYHSTSANVFHEKAKEYDSWYDKSLLFSIECAAITAVNDRTKNPGLEIGTGPGRFAEALGYSFGIDPANAPLHLAAKRTITPCQAVGEALPFQDNSLARVALFFTLCFVSDKDAVLRECKRVLKPHGHLLLGIVPSGSNWGIALTKKKNNGHPFYKYANFLTVKRCKELLEKCGFSIISGVSSLYQDPEKVETMEHPQSLLDEKAGFVVLKATC